MASQSLGFDQVDVSQLRTPYSQTVFTEDQLVSHTNPFLQFHTWFQAALECKEILEPMALSISTSTKEGKPSSRMVVMKSYSEEGITFFTDYESRTGKELEENPHTALLFFWPPLHKQVRIEGKVQKLTEELAEHFHSRPQTNQTDAVASWHSTTVLNHANWGGYLVVPSVFEFWQGQSTRLHDRIAFFKQESAGVWTVKRLAP